MKKIKCKQKDCVWNDKDGCCINENILSRYKDVRELITCVSFLKAPSSRKFVRQAQNQKNPMKLFSIIAELASLSDKNENDRDAYKALYESVNNIG